MKYKILTGIGLAAAAVLIFTTGFFVSEIHHYATAVPITGATLHTAEPIIADETVSSDEPALAAFSEFASSEIYTVYAKGKNLIVYSDADTVFMTAPLPTNLPPDDKLKLDNGVTLFGKEALLVFMEDFSE